MPVQIHVNGRTQECPDETTVDALLRELELDPATVVVELNTQILKKQDFASTLLADGDHLEVLRFVGGG